MAMVRMCRLFLAGCLMALGQAQDFSRHCKGPGETKAVITDGTYKGTWEVTVTFRQDLGGTPLTQTLQGGGGLHPEGGSGHLHPGAVGEPLQADRRNEDQHCDGVVRTHGSPRRPEV